VYLSPKKLVKWLNFVYHTGMTTYQFLPKQEPQWKPIPKPAEIAESRLIDAILDGSFPINSHLPGERELANALGVTRPTLREALQRLERDGWIEIHQGKPTRVRDYWHEGKLGVLNALTEHPTHLPPDFIPDLLKVRLSMAPVFTAMAVTNAPEKVVHFLEGRFTLQDSPHLFSNFDCALQHELTLLSNNPVFIMIMNGFVDMYLNLAPHYFALPAARKHSFQYYEDLSAAAQKRDQGHAMEITEQVMADSLLFWQQTNFN